MQALFSPASNKIVNAEMKFDTGGIIAQLNNLASLESNSKTRQDPLALKRMKTSNSYAEMPTTVSISSDKGESSSDESYGN